MAAGIRATGRAGACRLAFANGQLPRTPSWRCGSRCGGHEQGRAGLKHAVRRFSEQAQAVPAEPQMVRFHRPRAVGSVVIGDVSGAPAFPSRSAGHDRMRDLASDHRERHIHARPRSQEYSLPAAYANLLQRLQAQGPMGAEDAEGEDSEAKFAAEAEASQHTVDETNEQARHLWRGARQLARERLQSADNDLEVWEKRVASWHESLWIEELGTSFELRRLRLSVDSLPTTDSGLFMVDVIKLADSAAGQLDERALRGVQLVLTCNAGNKYRATVQPGSSSTTLLVSAPAPLAMASGPYTVEFVPQRFQSMAMHRALDAPRSSNILRATVGSAGTLDAPEQMRAGSTLAAAAAELAQTLPSSLNEAQRRAVAAAVEFGGMTARWPLLVWGPPGTGKTTLLAFIIWHLVQERPTDLHILAAAPSNTGADVLCRKLGKLGLDAGQMLRLNALGRSPSTITEETRAFCALGQSENGRPGFVVPSLPELRRFKVIVTTCICATHIFNALRKESTPAGWFSHVFVDEAGEATEPETLVPLSLLRPVAGAAVLLGDHFQLGPLVLSPLANEVGSLQASMIERLANERFSLAQATGSQENELNRDMLPLCEDKGLFFLTESYRSHEAIMSMYSKIFYSDQLEHRPRPAQQSVLPFFEAQGLHAPVLLHHLVGKERRDADSPSPYNPDEIRIVQRYLIDLLEDTSLGLQGRDIGVITPYNKQVQALETQLRSLGPEMAEVDVGTVEKFQGQERRVVVLSTVRSSGRGSPGQRRPIGFLSDRRRLNVSMSRAIAGLIVVGDLQLLSAHSAVWRKLVAIGKEMGCLRGEPLDGGSDRISDRQPAARESPRVQVAKASAAWETLTNL